MIASPHRERREPHTAPAKFLGYHVGRPVGILGGTTTSTNKKWGNSKREVAEVWGLRSHSGVRGVPLLPQEFERAYGGPRAHLPAMDIGPLVELQWEVSPGLDPLREHVVHDGLAGGTHHKGLFQVFAAACHNTLARLSTWVRGFQLSTSVMHFLGQTHLSTGH